MNRTLLLKLHRYVGLALAGLLIVLGATGSAIVFEPELDAWLNPELFRIDRPGGKALPPGELIRRVEVDDPRIRAYYLTLADRPEKAAVAYVAPRTDPATGEPFDVAYDEVFIDPVSGGINGRRLWGECCLERPNLMPFLYKLHNRLLLPMDIGRPLIGIVALLWLGLAVVGGYLTFPRGGPFFRRWRRNWSVGRGRTGFHTGLRLHRAGGLWLWPVIVAVALTGAMLGFEGSLRSVVGSISPSEETVWEAYADRDDVPAEPVSYTAALAAARNRVRRAGETGGPDHISYAGERGLYRVAFGDPDGFGLGTTTVYVDGRDGRVVGMTGPGDGSAGDVLLRAGQPLHAGRIAGAPGRIAVFLAGLVVVLLSVTGVVMWWLRRRRQ